MANKNDAKVDGVRLYILHRKNTEGHTEDIYVRANVQKDVQINRAAVPDELKDIFPYGVHILKIVSAKGYLGKTLTVLSETDPSSAIHTGVVSGGVVIHANIINPNYLIEPPKTGAWVPVSPPFT